MNIISLKKTFGFNSDESSKNNVFWHKTFGTPLRSSKISFKTSTGVSHRLYTRIWKSFLGNFCFFWGGLEWLKINYVTLSVVNKRRIYNIYIAQVITTLQQGESFFICLEKILSFLFYLNVSQCFFGSSYYRLYVQNRCVNWMTITYETGNKQWTSVFPRLLLFFSSWTVVNIYLYLVLVLIFTNDDYAFG